MQRADQPQAQRGSKMLLRRLANKRPEIFLRELKQAKFAPRITQITWLSPLKADGYAEYRDGRFLKAIDCTYLGESLRQFWPRRGPVWDGLATAANNTAFLVEAKAHVSELVSPASRAVALSRMQIEASLGVVKTYLDVKPDANWIGHYYQYTNRLAHLYFLRKHSVNAYLVSIYFLNDDTLNVPATRAEWEVALGAMHALLGTGRHKLSKYIVDVFIETSELKP